MAFKSDNHTQQPNEAYDIWLGQLPNAHYCVLSYIIRHTKGWHRDAARITYKQMIHGAFAADGARIDYGCGVKSSKTIAEALAHLEELDLVERVPGSNARGGVGVTSYRLKVAPEPAIQELPAAVAGASPSKEPAGASPSKEPVGSLASKSSALYPVKSLGALPSKEHSLSKESSKETTVKERGEGSLVAISSNIETSARTEDRRNRQRAREDPPEQLLDIDPLAGWDLDMALRIYEHWGGDPAEGVPADWCKVLRKHLADCTTAQREDFLSYLFSGKDVLRTLNSPRGVEKVLGEDAALWKARGMTDSKNTPGRKRLRAIPSAADVMEQDLGECCPECKKIAGAQHSYDCQFAGQVVGRERRTS